MAQPHVHKNFSRDLMPMGSNGDPSTWVVYIIPKPLITVSSITTRYRLGEVEVIPSTLWSYVNNSSHKPHPRSTLEQGYKFFPSPGQLVPQKFMAIHKCVLLCDDFRPLTDIHGHGRRLFSTRLP